MYDLYTARLDFDSLTASHWFPQRVVGYRPTTTSFSFGYRLKDINHVLYQKPVVVGRSGPIVPARHVGGTGFKKRCYRDSVFRFRDCDRRKKLATNVAELLPCRRRDDFGFAVAGKGACLRFDFSFRYPDHMRNKNKNICRGIGAKFLKRRLVKPLARLIERTAERQEVIMKRALTKVQDVEELIEIIARNVKRKADSQS
jgi:hypothetical protein